MIGVDFDNTIVCYDALFHRVARERGLAPAEERKAAQLRKARQALQAALATPN